MLIHFIAALQAATSNVVAVPPAPPRPMVTMPVPEVVARVPRTSAGFKVRLLRGTEVLIDEQVRVSSQSALINRSQSSALSAECPSSGRSLRSETYFNLRPDYTPPTTKDGFALSLRVGRGVQTGCNSGSRGVVIDEQFTLRPGQTLRLDGEGGVRLELTRLED